MTSKRWFLSGAAAGLAVTAMLGALRLDALGDACRAADLRERGLRAFVAGDLERAAALLERLELDHATCFLRGQIALETGDFEAARLHLARAVELEPTDRPTRLALAAALGELDRSGAEELLAGLVDEADPDPWTLAALQRLARAAFESERHEDGRRHLQSIEALRSFGLEPPTLAVFRMGSLTPP